MTTQERESQTAELFHGALACTPDQRSTFLKEACGGDEAMRLKVEALLAVYNDVRTAAPAPSTPNQQTDEAPFDPDVLIAISDRYESLTFIGSGGMGIVFRALDRETGRLVALKILRPAYAHDERFVERFRNEVRLALDIAHRNVCRTYNLERVNETLFISMEYVEGLTLRNILDHIEGVSVRQGLLWSQEICEALAETHRRGIVHRDLKPENIMIDREGHVKVMDFGVARTQSAEHSSVTIGVGTPRYMSPEQKRGVDVGPTSDIYSFGLVLYELFVGSKYSQEFPVPPRQANRYLPDHIDRAISRCLEQNPKDRFQSATEVKLALAGDQEPATGGQSAAPAKSVPKIVGKRATKTLVAVVCLFSTLLVARTFVVQRGPLVVKLHDGAVQCLAFSPNSRMLASGSEDRSIVLSEVTTLRKLHTLAGHTRAVTAVAFGKNGQWLVSGSADKTIRLWEVDTGRPIRTLVDEMGVVAVALSPDGRWLASASNENIKLWDVETVSVAHVLKHNDAVTALDFSADGRFLASASHDEKVRIWEVESGRLSAGPLLHGDAVKVVAFSPDGRLLASGSNDKTINLWSAATGAIVQTLRHEDWVSVLSFNVDGKLLASASIDGNVKVWEAPTWREVVNLKTGSKFSEWAFSPDGQTLGLGTDDGRVGVQPLKQWWQF